jgi:hypothetical protein
MSQRNVKGKARTESPRIKDTPALKAARNPSDGRAKDGRFAAGNRVGIGAGYKALIRRGLGDASDPATKQLVKEATRLYLALLRSLPSDGPGVRQLVAAQSRHAMLATHYANEAAKVGLATSEGLKLAEASRSHDGTAQRLATTAYDRAVRESNSKKAGRNSILDAIEAAGSEDES